MAVPVWSDRGGMASCAETLARGGDEALVLFGEDCHLESCAPTLRSASLILWAGTGEQPPRSKGKVSSPQCCPSDSLPDCRVAPFSHWHPSPALTDGTRALLISLEGKPEGEGPREAPVGRERNMSWRKGPALPPGSSE